MKSTDASVQPHQYSLTKGQIVPISAKRTTLPLIVYGDDAGQSGSFVPSGYMGDAAGIEVKSMEDSVPLKSGAPGVHCLRVSYLSNPLLRKKSNREGWVGVYWQTPANNWGKVKGAGYDLTSAEKLTVWLRGDKGGEILSEIKVGGLTGPYPDTDVASAGPFRLTTEWQQYTIPLNGKDLRHISGGFAFGLRRADNPRGAIIYIDEVMYESGDSSTPASHGDNALSKPLSESTKQTTKNTKIPTETLTESRKFVIPFDNYQEHLDDIVRNAYKYISSPILIEGHTDSVGSEDVNQKLSLERAKAVADYLESKGIDSKRITVEGYGEEHLLMPDSDSAENRAKNRRIEITFLVN